MIEITERQLTLEEKKTLESQYGTFDKRAGKAATIFFFSFVACLLPLLAIDKYIYDVPSNIELIAFIPMIIISAFATYKIYKVESITFKAAKEALDSGTVTVYKIRTNRVFRR